MFAGDLAAVVQDMLGLHGGIWLKPYFRTTPYPVDDACLILKKRKSTPIANPVSDCLGFEGVSSGVTKSSVAAPQQGSCVAAG